MCIDLLDRLGERLDLSHDLGLKFIFATSGICLDVFNNGEYSLCLKLKQFLLLDLIVIFQGGYHRDSDICDIDELLGVKER